MHLAILAILGGLVLLIWSADRFVDGAAATAKHFGMPTLLVGMVIVGFGTSVPELIVSAFSALDGQPDLALGNAYGSNIANIALILGITALIKPIAVQSDILRKELPILTGVTLLAAWQLLDGEITRLDAAILLAVFLLIMSWTIRQGLKKPDDPLAREQAQEAATHKLSIGWAIFWVVVGLLLMMASSKLLVWGAIEIAHAFHVSELVIGLTIVAVGTSLPELASSIIAARKGEHDLVVGNILGSNLFNTLAVVGLAAAIKPFPVDRLILTRDMTVVGGLTLSLFVLGYGYKTKPGHIGRFDGALLLTAFIAYTVYLMTTTFVAAPGAIRPGQ